MPTYSILVDKCRALWLCLWAFTWDGLASQTNVHQTLPRSLRLRGKGGAGNETSEGAGDLRHALLPRGWRTGSTEIG